MNVGPLGSNNFSEVSRLARGIYETFVETISVDAVRGALGTQGVAYLASDRQLVLLRKLLANITGQTEQQVQPMLNALKLVYELRVSEAHSTGVMTGAEMLGFCRQFGVVPATEDARPLWFSIVDAVACLARCIATCL